MNYKYWRNAAVAAGIIGAVGVGGTALAQNTTVQNNMQNQGVFKAFKQGWQNMRQDMKAVQDAITKRNYSAWKNLVSVDGQVPVQFQTITADNFSKFADMHDAMQSGDSTKADALRQELGLPERPMMGRGQDGPKLTVEQQAQLKTAIQNKDFDTWKTLVSVNGQLPPKFQSITADNFAKFSEMHGLMDQAQQLRQELGLTAQGKGGGMGMHRGMGMGQPQTQQ